MRSWASFFLVIALSAPALALAAERITLSFDEIQVRELARTIYGEIGKGSFVLGQGLQNETVSIKLNRVSPAEAVAAMDRVLDAAGFAVERKAGVVWIDKKKDEDEILVYKPVHRSVRYLADVVQATTRARSLQARSIRSGVEAPIANKGPGLESPTSALGQIDRQEVDQLAFSVPKQDVAKVRKLLGDLDTESGEVVLKAVVYEVGTDRQKGGALQLAASLLGGKLGLNVAGGSFAGASVTTTGRIEAVASALDADSRFKSITRPQVRVRNGATARFSVGQDVPVLGAVRFDQNGNSVQSVDYKQSGIILTATPEIRQGTVELDLSQELSSFVLTNTGVNNSPTLQKRSVSTKLSLKPNEVVILAGLDEEREEEQHSRLPFLGWLIGDREAGSRSEIIVLVEVQRL